MQCLLVLLCLCVATSVLADSLVIGNVRVSSFDGTVYRVEPQGPRGFEDRTTFNVYDRSPFDASFPLKLVNTSTQGTQTVSVIVSPMHEIKIVADVGIYSQVGTDVNRPNRTSSYPWGTKANQPNDCLQVCQSDPECVAFVFADDQYGNNNCWPLNYYSNRVSAAHRWFGCIAAGCMPTITQVVISDRVSGVALYAQNRPLTPDQSHLHWPAPNVASSSAYSFMDFPRFYVPPWGPTPIPAGQPVDPALVHTNGYDYRNNVYGDQYVFLLGSSLASWAAARQSFIKVFGSTPLLPDFAYGTWFTWWTPYSYQNATAEVERWKSDDLPIDVWALDMNWRFTDNNMDRSYDHPNTDLFPNFTQWFDFLSSAGLRTYFNDHPFPVADQTTHDEVAFRWQGLSEWMSRGLTYWWFDHNWGFSIPPPNTPPVNGWDKSNTDGNWEGLVNTAWGSHVYYTSVSVYDQQSRPSSFPRPMTLTKFAPPDWVLNYDPAWAAEQPGHHRTPIWWTGDGVTLGASVQSMVDSGIHGFKPYVHSDCGGDYRSSSGDLLRWIAHCVFGTILRLHGSDHRPWSYGSDVEDQIRNWLQLRYSMIPSLITAGTQASISGFPLVARADLFWPEHYEAADSSQYIHLNETLIAPLYDSYGMPAQPNAGRSVWVPPGVWQDAYTGQRISGPLTLYNVQQPWERQPMWHRVGGFLVMATKAAHRVDDTDWTQLTLEAFVELGASSTVRDIYTAAQADVLLPPKVTIGVHSSNDTIVLSIAEFSKRLWTVRLHLPVGVRVTQCSHDMTVNHIAPIDETQASTFFPLRGAGSAPAHLAGLVAEAPLVTDRPIEVECSVQHV